MTQIHFEARATGENQISQSSSAQIRHDRASSLDATLDACHKALQAAKDELFELRVAATGIFFQVSDVRPDQPHDGYDARSERNRAHVVANDQTNARKHRGVANSGLVPREIKATNTHGSNNLTSRHDEFR